MFSRSSVLDILLVAKRWKASSTSSDWIPTPLSDTRISSTPPSRTSTEMRVAPASSEFSMSSLTADAGRSTTSPPAICAGWVVWLSSHYKVKRIVSGMAHITGGGLDGNLARVLPKDVDAVVDTGAWDVPPVFEFLRERGGVDEQEMRRVFNMGIGYVLIVRPTFAESVIRQLQRLGENPVQIGRIVKGSGRVRHA